MGLSGLFTEKGCPTIRDLLKPVFVLKAPVLPSTVSDSSAALGITMALLRPHEVMKMVSSPREGWQGTGRVGASAGGQGRVSNPPLRGLARVEVGTLPEAIFKQ